ncbi:MAG: hypothetical protein IJU35_02085 [Paludibacteraceae bacterium]|nr:hypothetical protein [Paludibacteraceae bacterium]
MIRNLFTFFIALLTSITIQAQYVVSDKYDLWFADTDYEVTTHKPEYCTEHYQDLRNGCQVRLSGRKVYIYRNGYSILYGDEINVLYNGYYRVRRGNTWYLADEDGELVSGIYGKEILYYPFGYVTVQRSSGNWDIYHCSGSKVETYSYEIPLLCGNGCFCVKHGKYWYAVDKNGRQISGVYGDQIILLNNGTWKCIRGNYVEYVE